MKTDDCRVEASIVSVGSKLAERVTSVDVEEGETVRRGQTRAHLDSRTMQAVSYTHLHGDEENPGPEFGRRGPFLLV